MIYGNTRAQCTDYIYTVSRDTKQVSVVRKIKAGMENVCPDTAKELKLRLTEGFPVYWEMRKEAKPVTAGIAAVISIVLWAGFRIRKMAKGQPVVSQ